ncbi:MAG TPA: hypothetical protein VG456_02385 [Candidatus Sulfopaludibacter sp.]|nr:hypothetical protein [Candidatus Sulfopaludibacter sp.]
MTEDDPLRPLLREWQAPEPGADMDERIRSRWQAARADRDKPAQMRHWWRARVSIPVPVLAAAILIILALLVELRPAPPPVTSNPGYLTRLGAAGFQPLPDGAARLLPGEVHQ